MYYARIVRLMKPRKAVTAYILQLQPGGNIIQSGSASINVKTIEKLSGEKKFKFHPSGLGQKPANTAMVYSFCGQ